MSTQGHAGSSTGASTMHGVSQAQADRAAAVAGARESLSRQPSVSASGASTPARQSMEIPRMSGNTLYTLPHRPSISRDPSATTMASTHAQSGTPAASLQQLPSPAQSPNVTSAMQHYADTAAYRTEMEIVKAENEALRQRVRALERALRTRRDSSQSDAHRPADLRSTRESSEAGGVSNRASQHLTSLPTSAGLGVAAWAANDGGVRGVAGPRERSESQSTTASSRRGLSGAAPEDEVRVGESASSVGVGRGV